MLRNKFSCCAVVPSKNTLGKAVAQNASPSRQLGAKPPIWPCKRPGRRANMTVGARAGRASRECCRCSAPPLRLGRAVLHVQGRALTATCRRRAAWRRPVRNTAAAAGCYARAAMRLRALQTPSAGALLGQAGAAVLVSTILLRRKHHGRGGRKGLLPQHAWRAARARSVECSPCVLRAVGRVFRHCMRAVAIATVCERVLRCWIRILIFSGISDIYLQLISSRSRKPQTSNSVLPTLQQ